MVPRRGTERRSGRPLRLLLTCEHGGNDIPPEYRRHFRGQAARLASHEGLDIGARAAARFLQRRWQAPLVAGRVSRLLVDLNRSPGHPALFSATTRALPLAGRDRILARHYHPYRRLVRDWIAACIGRGERVIHISVHSFVARLRGRTRRCDVGLLYDPRRRDEAAFCRRWQHGLGRRWRVRRNYPYRGTSDGQVVELRRSFPAADYIGIEIEINQSRLADPVVARRLLGDLAASLPG